MQAGQPSNSRDDSPAGKNSPDPTTEAAGRESIEQPSSAGTSERVDVGSFDATTGLEHVRDRILWYQGERHRDEQVLLDSLVKIGCTCICLGAATGAAGVIFQSLSGTSTAAGSALQFIGLFFVQAGVLSITLCPQERHLSKHTFSFDRLMSENHQVWTCILVVSGLGCMFGILLPELSSPFLSPLGVLIALFGLALGKNVHRGARGRRGSVVPDLESPVESVNEMMNSSFQSLSSFQAQEDHTEKERPVYTCPSTFVVVHLLLALAWQGFVQISLFWSFLSFAVGDRNGCQTASSTGILGTCDFRMFSGICCILAALSVSLLWLRVHSNPLDNRSADAIRTEGVFIVIYAFLIVTGLSRLCMAVGSEGAELRDYILLGACWLALPLLMACLGQKRSACVMRRLFIKQKTRQDGAFIAELLDTVLVPPGGCWYVLRDEPSDCYDHKDFRKYWRRGVVERVSHGKMVVSVSRRRRSLERARNENNFLAVMAAAVAKKKLMEEAGNKQDYDASRLFERKDDSLDDLSIPDVTDIDDEDDISDDTSNDSFSAFEQKFEERRDLNAKVGQLSRAAAVLGARAARSRRKLHPLNDSPMKGQGGRLVGIFRNAASYRETKDGLPANRKGKRLWGVFRGALQDGGVERIRSRGKLTTQSYYRSWKVPSDVTAEHERTNPSVLSGILGNPGRPFKGGLIAGDSTNPPPRAPEAVEKIIINVPYKKKSDELLKEAEANLRCIAWEDIDRDLMGSSHSRPADFKRSRALRKGEKIDFFMSHSWNDDPELKFAALERAVVRFQKRKNRSPTFWLDKVCIDQSNIIDGLKVLPINIAACNKVLVLCGETYPHRLWCVWELFTLFAFSNEDDARASIEFEPVREHIGEVLRKLLTKSEPDAGLVPESLKQFRLARAHCFDPNEENRLRGIIEARGIEVFENRISDLAFQCQIAITESRNTERMADWTHLTTRVHAGLMLKRKMKTKMNLKSNFSYIKKGLSRSLSKVPSLSRGYLGSTSVNESTAQASDSRTKDEAEV